MDFSKHQIESIRRECKRLVETKQVSQKLLDFIYEHQLFKLFVPKAFGGKMVDFPSAIKVFQYASFIDGNFGWLITIGSGGGMFVPNMTEEAARTFFTPQNAVVAGSGYPAGSARPTDNGYIINGKWLYCSGSEYATLFTVTCIVEGDDNTKNEVLAFALEPGQVDVLEDWDAFGLKGTSSHSIQVTNQFVPKHQAFSVLDFQNHYGGKVHTLPFALFSEASFTAVSLGIGKHFLEEVDMILQKNKEKWQNGPVNRYAFLEEKLLEETNRLEKASKAFHDMVDFVWQRHIEGEELGDFEQEFSTIAKRSVTTALYCADQLIRYTSMEAIMEKSPLNQIWCDLHTASQHTFLIPYNEIEAKPF